MKDKAKILVFVSFTIVLFLYTFNYTSSRYLGKLSSNDDVVAIPVLNLSNNGTSYELTNILPGYTGEKEFEVTNTSDTRVNEILLKYYFQITTNSQIPLNVKIYNENNEELTLREGKTPEEEMEKGTQVTKKYKVVISWDEQNNSYEYAGLPASIKVDLVATQVLEGS